MGPPLPPPAAGTRGRAGPWVGLSQRDRSSSANKRRRVDDGHDEVTAANTNEASTASGPRDRQPSKTRKFLVGTLNTNDKAERKMKSPSADIFIYGVHRETTEEDISNDLRESDIIVDVKDIVKKSKPEAGLNSFKISIKAEDLKKALNPEIWPMRVKVREYIYYSKRTLNGRGQGGQ